jgi:hypothetical protein
MRSSDWRKRAAEIGRLMQRLRPLAAKQRLLAQQHRCLAMARAAEKREQEEQCSTINVPPPSSRFDASQQEAREGIASPQQSPAIPRPEPSALIKASPFLTKLWEQGMVSAEELERRARSIELLKGRLSGTHYHADRAAHDPDYWNKLYDARVNW